MRISDWSSDVCSSDLAMRAGATDFLSKPIAPDRLLAALHSAVSTSSDTGELRPLTEKMPAPLAFEEIVGSAPQFRAALAIDAKAARRSDERSAGKEWVRKVRCRWLELL